MGNGGRDKLLEQVQNDLKNISLESKKSKSLQGLREATEEAIVRVRDTCTKPGGLWLLKTLPFSVIGQNDSGRQCGVEGKRCKSLHSQQSDLVSAGPGL